MMAALNSFDSMYWLTLLFVSSLKATGICALVYGWFLLVRQSSAALRHWIGSLALLSTLVIPLFTLVIPSWSAFPVTFTPNAARNTSFSRQANPLLLDTTNEAHPAASHTGSGIQSKASVPGDMPVTAQQAVTGPVTPAPTFPLRWSDLAFALWALGAGVTLARWIGATLRVRRCVREGWQSGDPAWGALRAALCTALKIRRPVLLIFSDTVNVPLTFGWLRPVILLPNSALNWPAERRRIVVLHELVHIARWDYLTQW